MRRGAWIAWERRNVENRSQRFRGFFDEVSWRRLDCSEGVGVSARECSSIQIKRATRELMNEGHLLLFPFLKT